METSLETLRMNCKCQEPFRRPIFSCCFLSENTKTIRFLALLVEDKEHLRGVDYTGTICSRVIHLPLTSRLSPILLGLLTPRAPHPPPLPL